jgi:O-antigen/teichoic acid export membrane protein
MSLQRSDSRRRKRPSMTPRLSGILHSPALWAAFAFTISGLGFALASLLLARSLPKVEFGALMLALALVTLGVQFAPFGADGVINRRHVDFGRALFWRAFATSLMTALVFLIGARLGYALAWQYATLVLAGVGAGGLGRVSAAKFQSLERFSFALWLLQGANLALLLAAAFLTLSGLRLMFLPLAAFVLGFVFTAGWGWTSLFRRRRSEVRAFEPFSWREALAYAGVHLAGVVMTQLDRLVIPKLLSFEELASFSVLAAVTIAPFRMLQLGLGYTLLPRIRNAATVVARRHVFLQEALISGLVVTTASVAIWLLAPLVVHLVLGDKYILGPALIAAALVSGLVRVMTGFTRAAVSALCSNRELAYLSGLMWLAVAVAIGGAAVGAHWGLVGVVYGVSLGWVAQVIVSVGMVLPYLKIDPSHASQVTPGSSSRELSSDR